MAATDFIVVKGEKVIYHDQGGASLLGSSCGGAAPRRTGPP